jgi:DNA-binding MarR family transcriptional regulator
MPAPLDRYTDLERALTRLVRRAFLPTAGEATRRAAGVHLERAAYATLVRVAALDGTRLSDLAAALGLDVSTASRHAKRLVDAGYVEVAPDPDDARARRYRPTAAGRDALAGVRDARRSHLARVLDDWDADEVTRLAEGLDRLVDALEADERDRP